MKCKYCNRNAITVLGMRTELHTKDCPITKENEQYLVNYYKAKKQDMTKQEGK